MATDAAGRLEQRHAAQLGRRQRIAVAAHEAVVGRVGGDQGSFIGGYRLGDALECDRRAPAEGAVETLAIGRLVAHAPRDSLARGHAHLDRIERRPHGLVFQRGGAAVPEQHGLERGVPHRRCVAAAELAADALRAAAAVHAGAAFDVVAGGAGNLSCQ